MGQSNTCITCVRLWVQLLTLQKSAEERTSVVDVTAIVKTRLSL